MAARPDSLTLLLEPLPSLAALADGPHPALDRVFSRAHIEDPGRRSLDQLRCAWFGLDVASGVPAGALTWLADQVDDAPLSGSGRWFLRADPVSLHADMTRVFMTSVGCGDMPEADWRALAAAAAEVLSEAGLELHAVHPDRWVVTSAGPPDVPLTPVSRALGVDLAELMPAGAGGKPWRRLHNELQMALHDHPVNRDLRDAGQEPVNGLWFWGEGAMPTADELIEPPRSLRVHSDHPLTRGLARLAGTTAGWPAPGIDPAGSGPGGGAVLVDWSVPREAPAAQLKTWDALVQAAERSAKAAGNELEIWIPGACLRYTRKSARQFWRRSRPFAERLPSPDTRP